jgi:hypothetical protein
MEKMEMSVLYKDKYLIALYDKHDNLVDVGLRPKELELYKDNPRTFYECVCRGDKTFRGCKLFLIDCTVVHDDIFKEEDEIFIKEIVEPAKSTDAKVKDISKKLGVSKRTVYRWKAQGKIKGF